MSRRDSLEHARVTDPEARKTDGMLRRMAISLTSRVLWQLLGHKGIDGKRETLDFEVFPGIGFYARPAAGAKAEAIVASVGDAAGAVVVATRAEGMRYAAVGDGDEDRTSSFNSQSIVDILPDGAIEAKSIGGAAAALATHADLEALREVFNNWAPTGVIGDAQALKTLLTTLLATGWPAGTSVLKGE